VDATACSWRLEVSDGVAFEVRVVGEHFVDGSPAGSLAEHYADRDAEVADAGHAAHPIRVDGDALEHHAEMLRAQQLERGCQLTPG
jgi:hypothetical protein